MLEACRAPMTWIAPLIFLAFYSSISAAQPAMNQNRAEIIEQRQAIMDRVGSLMKALTNSSRNGFEDLAAAKRDAATLNNSARQITNFWPANTAIGIGKSAAKPEIWTRRAQFDAEMAEFVSAAAQLNDELARGDRLAARQQLNRLGSTCKTCHTNFKGKKP